MERFQQDRPRKAEGAQSKRPATRVLVAQMPGHFHIRIVASFALFGDRSKLPASIIKPVIRQIIRDDLLLFWQQRWLSLSLSPPCAYPSAKRRSCTAFVPSVCPFVCRGYNTCSRFASPPSFGFRTFYSVTRQEGRCLRLGFGQDDLRVDVKK